MPVAENRISRGGCAVNGFGGIVSLQSRGGKWKRLRQNLSMHLTVCCAVASHTSGDGIVSSDTMTTDEDKPNWALQTLSGMLLTMGTIVLVWSAYAAAGTGSKWVLERCEGPRAILPGMIGAALLILGYRTSQE